MEVVLLLLMLPGVSLGRNIICRADSRSEKNATVENHHGFSERYCQLDRLEHVTSWMRNNSAFTGKVGMYQGRDKVEYFPAEENFQWKWPGLLSPCDADWMGIIRVVPAPKGVRMVEGVSYKGKVFVERPSFKSYVAWSCDDSTSMSKSGSFCRSDNAISSGLITAHRVLWIGDVACQVGTPITDDVFNELATFSQSEYPDICKIDGEVFNECEQETGEMSFDLNWMDVGKAHKILMREHSTKWLQESTRKDFVCITSEGDPCPDSDEDECFINEKCSGDTQFCINHGCVGHQGKNSTPCHCELVDKPGALTVRYGGISVRPYCYGFSRMMVTFSRQTKQFKKSGCTGCEIECYSGGVRLITLTSKVKDGTACIGQMCASIQGGAKRTEIKFHERVLVGKLNVMIDGRLEEGASFSLKGYCHFPSGCEAVSCTFCHEFLRNPQCYPVKKWLFIFIVFMVLWIALMLVTSVLRAVILWWSVIYKPVKLVLIILKRIIRTIFSGFNRVRVRGQIIMQEEEMRRGEANYEAAVFNPRARPRVFLPTLLMMLFLITLCSGCDELVMAESKMITCKRGTGNYKECQVTGRALLPAVNPGQEACLHFQTNESPETKCFKIKVKSINLKCKQGSTYFVPETRSRCTSVRRCRWAGDCQSGCPDGFRQHSFSGDWTARMDRSSLGWSGCADGCGGAACGCFNAAPSCIFWRKWLENPSGRAWKVSPCIAWVLAADIEVTLPSGEKRGMHPLSGVATQMFKGVSLTYLGSSSNYVGLSNLCEMSEEVSDEMAIAPCNLPGHATMGSVGEVQCSSLEGAKKINKDSCVWDSNLIGVELRTDDITCYTKLTSVEAVANYSRVPCIMGGIRFERSPHERGRVIGSPTDITSVKGSFSVTFRGLRLKLSETMATCTGEFVNLTGCYSCMHGATAEFKISSNKNTTAHVVCEHDKTAFEVHEGMRVYKAPLSFNSAVVKETCEFVCGGQKSQFQVEGNLVFLDIPKVHEGSYMKTFHSSVGGGASVPNPLDWLSALFGNSLSHWILGIIGLAILSMIALVLIRNLILSLSGSCKRKRS
ncbi:polyprotein [Hunter Island virus]|uniref:Envelopment polyprotein n=1 Tax=Hunter Island virus TaxID=1457386 RepID=A0A0K0MI13_9VIRU|nr:polyprotein [Hunter Island virus]AKC91377.1 polyprotein [Hunter Island virus]